MKHKITKFLSVGCIFMGITHIAATFTPVISGKLAPLDSAGQKAFIYMSLMCGALLILGGVIVQALSKISSEHTALRKPFVFTLLLLTIDGLLAAYSMPRNPCAWLVLALTIPLFALNIKKR